MATLETRDKYTSHVKVKCHLSVWNIEALSNVSFPSSLLLTSLPTPFLGSFKKKLLERELMKQGMGDCEHLLALGER